MSSINSRPRPVGSAAAISRGPSKKTADYSPELKRQADEITEKILSRMRESVLAAALHALDQQKNDSSARIWMERRIFRPAQQIFERAIQVKKAAIPPPSTRSPEREVETLRRQVSIASENIRKIVRALVAAFPEDEEVEEVDDADEEEY
jgi:hypothetical protein